ncbi:ABC transporter substrate-binding protein [Oligoflexia bacterium]|nr:ABC transporter substrate-binding protein [Oligoflexia bacterium]
MNSESNLVKGLLVFCPCLLFLLASLQVWAEPRVKIGISVPLSGNEATFGEDVRDTVRFANSYLADNQYDLIFENDRCNGKDVVTAASKLLNLDKIDGAIVVCSGAVLGSASLYEKAKVVAISPYASSPAISQAGDYIFRTWPSDVTAGQLLATRASDRYGTTGLMTEQTEYCVGLEEAFLNANTTRDLEVHRERFLTEDRDVRTTLLRLKSKKIKVLFINSQSEQTFLNVFKQARAIGLDIPVLGAYWPGSPSFRKVASSSVNGIEYVDSPLLSTSLTPEGKRIFGQYVQKYGEPNSSPFLFATTLEAFRVLHLALQSKKQPKELI